MRSEKLLNGYWDFMPLEGESGKGHSLPGGIPESGWLKDTMLVPGSWTHGVSGVDFGDSIDGKPWQKWDLFNNYDYPAEWDAMDSAWYRRCFDLDQSNSDCRYLLNFGGILREAWIFVNGIEVGHSLNGILPYECDITDAVHSGVNELAIYVTDYRRNSDGKVYTPFGADQMLSQKGIWQDVTLKTVPTLRIQDVTIRTSVRENMLSLTVDLTDQSDPTDMFMKFTVRDGETTVLEFSCPAFALSVGENRTITVEQQWNDYKLWSHHDPHLYTLEITLRDGDKIVDRMDERFGFREVWIEGPDLLLNGVPLHLSGDWSHRLSMESLTTAYFKKWFGMLKDCNMNYIRTHTFPHPTNLLDLADEMGILISLESGWHFGGGFALDEEEFWQAALQHVRDIIRRDKNHPSIILWSVGNEVRWSGNQPAIIKNVPRLRALYEELDPTRPAYHDGDSSLWDERTQPMLSRHYGLECTGEGWWDKKQPLHVGEIGKWHYGQPIDNCVWGNDSVFASFEECHRAIARECADQIEQSRANGVCCIFPWNLSGLDNFRPWAEERHFEVDDPGSEGIKVVRSAPYGSEFAWWDNDKNGYAPGVSFNIIRHALRTVALLVREKRSSFFGGQIIQHTITAINDGPEVIETALNVRMKVNTDTWEHNRKLRLVPGRNTKIELDIHIPETDTEIDVMLVSQLLDGTSVLDEHTRLIRITPSSSLYETWHVPPTALLGSDQMEHLLNQHKIKTLRIDSIAELDAEKTPLVVIGHNTVTPGSIQNQELKKFLIAGGRALVLEQSCSIFPELSIDLKPVETCHNRSQFCPTASENIQMHKYGNKVTQKHEIPAGDSTLADSGVSQCNCEETELPVNLDVSPHDLQFWGNDPYGKSNSDSWVTVNPYRKDAIPGGQFLLHSGFGDFGSDGLYWSPLLTARIGSGIVAASQLRLSEKATDTPVAHRILRQLLEQITSWQAPETTPIHAIDHESANALHELGAETRDTPTETASINWIQADALTPETTARLAKQTANGATTVIMQIAPQHAAMLSNTFNTKIDVIEAPREEYMLLRAGDSPLLNGISNQETCWLQKMQYSKPNRKNRPITRYLLQCPDAEELLVSEHSSCWHEFYLDGACSERLRMPVVTALLRDAKPQSAAGMLAINHGKGRLILSQLPFPLDDEHDIARCFWTQFINNLGGSFSTTILDGDCVRPGSMRSDGFPTEFGFITNPGNSTLQQILKTARPTEYRIHNHALVYGYDWEVAEFDDGIFRIENHESVEKVIIAFQINAGRPRMISYAEDGLPDPTEQTLCDLKGHGRVTPHINGIAFDPIELGDNGHGVIPDIDLNMDWNTIVLIWEPKSSELAISWRDRQRHPEVEFAFMFKNTKHLSGAVHQ